MTNMRDVYCDAQLPVESINLVLEIKNDEGRYDYVEYELTIEQATKVRNALSLGVRRGRLLRAARRDAYRKAWLLK